MSKPRDRLEGDDLPVAELAADLESKAVSPVEAAWPFNADSPHVADILAEGLQVRVLLVDVIGMEWAEIEDRLDVIVDSARFKSMVPVFLTDVADFRGFREAGVVYDTVPNAAAMAPILPDLDWVRYVKDRRRHAVEKWRPAASVRLGPVMPGEAE